MTQVCKIVVLENHCKAARGAVTGRNLGEAALAGGHVIEAEAKINANRVFSAYATNTLASSILTVLSSSGDTAAEVDVGPTVVYGRIQELGGIIKPVHKKLLAWIDRETGEWAFARLVQLLPHPYLRPAVDNHEEEIGEAVGAALKSQIEGALE